MSRLDSLVAAFRARTLTHAEWTHVAHLSVGAWYVHQYGEDALGRLRAEIRLLNERHGTVNSTTSGYHETITAAYVKLISAFLATFDAEVPLATRVAALVTGPLGERRALLRFWSAERLMSPEARAAWVPPDLQGFPGS